MSTAYHIKASSERNSELRARNSRLPLHSSDAELQTDWSAEEYVLLGYIGSIHATARSLAAKTDFDIARMEIAVEAIRSEKAVDHESGLFESLVITITPETKAHHVALIGWLRQIQRTCPVFATLPQSTEVYTHIRHFSLN